MEKAETFEGTEYVLRAKGLGRFLVAAFLGLWLCGWAAGEVFAAGFAWKLASAFVTGSQVPVKGMPGGAGVLAVGGFILVWLTFWTLGGLAAFMQFAKMLWGRERVVVRPDCIRVSMTAFPFWSRKTIHAFELSALYSTGRQGRLLAMTTKGKVTLCTMSSAEENAELQKVLESTFRRQLEAPAAMRLGEGWQVEVGEAGRKVLMRSRRRAWRISIILASLAFVLCLLVSILVLKALFSPALWIPAAVITVMGSLVGWGSWHVATTRTEFEMRQERITVRRVKREKETLRWEAVRMELRDSRDSDGDLSYRLVLRESPTAGTGKDGRAREEVIFTAMNDPLEAKALAGWIVSNSQIPFEDCSTERGRHADWSSVRAKLADSGKLGEWLADKLGPRG